MNPKKKRKNIIKSKDITYSFACGSPFYTILCVCKVCTSFQNNPNGLQPVSSYYRICLWKYLSNICMVLIIDGNSEIGAHIKSKLCYLICIRHLIRPRTVSYRNFSFPVRPIFLNACAICPELVSNIRTMDIPNTICPTWHEP